MSKLLFPALISPPWSTDWLDYLIAGLAIALIVLVFVEGLSWRGD